MYHDLLYLYQQIKHRRETEPADIAHIHMCATNRSVFSVSRESARARGARGRQTQSHKPYVPGTAPLSSQETRTYTRTLQAFPSSALPAHRGRDGERNVWKCYIPQCYIPQSIRQSMGGEPCLCRTQASACLNLLQSSRENKSCASW